MTPLEAMLETVDNLKPLLTDKGVVKWFNTPMQKLNWATPLEALIEGCHEDVVRVSEGYHEFVY